VSLRKPATFAETGWLTTWSVALILAQALRQLPLEALNPLALAVLAACAIALLATYVIVASALRRSGELSLAAQRSRIRLE